jgi:glycosyltransferase involved in cell wall biosynthesis
MNISELSVITIVRNRARHLARLVEGLVAGTAHPRELIVVDMSDVAIELPMLPFPAKRVGLDAGGLPLAAARNAGATAAGGQRLLFLDVDCIPRRNLVATIDAALTETDALICPEVRYLGPEAAELMDEAAFERMSVHHPVRSFPESGYRAETNAGLFWSLTFGIRRARYAALGGFDAGYAGYGAEDTDFGFRAREAGLPLLFLGGTGSFHQYHGVISPPLQHLADIVRNAAIFRARWGIWPMTGWLEQFAAMGLVAFDDNELRLIREATPAEFAAATQPPSVYF